MTGFILGAIQASRHHIFKNEIGTCTFLTPHFSVLDPFLFATSTHPRVVGLEEGRSAGPHGRDP